MGRIELPSPRYECGALPTKLHRHIMERVNRFELSSSPWQGNILPLNYTRIIGSEKRSRTSTASFKDSRPAVNRSRIKLAGCERIELPCEGSEPSVLPLNEHPTSNWLQRQDSNLHISALTVRRITFLLRWNIPKRRSPQTLFWLGGFTLSTIRFD